MLRAVVGFGAFGLFWGAWGAILPAVRAESGVNDGQLGVALLMVGLGALASMRFTGYLIDRYGGVVLPVIVVLFGVCGVLPALTGSVVTLSSPRTHPMVIPEIAVPGGSSRTWLTPGTSAYVEGDLKGVGVRLRWQADRGGCS